jgi:NTP pyrophosphatase (non-canonical NTP hydrolase)
MDELIERVIIHNTSEKNAICCIEEMSELTKVLTKKLRNSKKFNRELLIEEIAHVLLMCNVIAAEYIISEDMIREVQKDAVKRMEENR